MTCSGSSKVRPVTATVLVLPDLLCPSCGGGVEASVGTSAGYFTGHREYYATLTVRCRGCGRSGGAAFYRGEAYLEPALEDAVQQFLLRDSRPRLSQG